MYTDTRRGRKLIASGPTVCGHYRARTADLLYENRLFVIEVSLGSESGGFEERLGGVVDEVSESESGAA